MAKVADFSRVTISSHHVSTVARCATMYRYTHIIKAEVLYSEECLHLCF